MKMNLLLVAIFAVYAVNISHGILSEAEQTYILDAHNLKRHQMWKADFTGKKLREYVDENGMRSYPKNVNVLKWLPELAETAQLAADQCVKAHLDKDSELELELKRTYGTIGENFYGGNVRSTAVDTAMNGWYDEVAYSNWETFTCDSSSPVQGCSHFRAIINADTQWLGCAHADCGKWHQILCRYIKIVTKTFAGDFDLFERTKNAEGRCDASKGFTPDDTYTNLCNFDASLIAPPLTWKERSWLEALNTKRDTLEWADKNKRNLQYYAPAGKTNYARNMMVLKWHHELAATAQVAADACASGPLPHDSDLEVRIMADFGSEIGESRYTAGTWDYVDLATNTWYKERKVTTWVTWETTPNDVFPTSDNVKLMLNANTEYVGCAGTKCGPDNFNVICRYIVPADLSYGVAPFDLTTSESERCDYKEGLYSTSTKYPNLCEKD